MQESIKEFYWEYKNKMKTNTNMSVGIFKNTLIYILLKNNEKNVLKLWINFAWQ